jgi:hypothetical protein
MVSSVTIWALAIDKTQNTGTNTTSQENIFFILIPSSGIRKTLQDDYKDRSASN